MSLESVKHKATVQLTAATFRIAAERDEDHATCMGLHWRVNRPAPHYGIWEEYPMLVGDNMVWDEIDHQKWGKRPPTYREMLDMGYGSGEFYIADVAIQHKGYINSVLELVHTSLPSDEKMDWMKSGDCEAEVFIVCCEWFQCLTGVPKDLKCVASIEGYPRRLEIGSSGPAGVRQQDWEKWRARNRGGTGGTGSILKLGQTALPVFDAAAVRRALNEDGGD